MRNELTTGEQCVIAATLAHRVGQCGERIDALTAMSDPNAGRQVDMISYWIRSQLEAQRTLVRAREVFWS